MNTNSQVVVGYDFSHSATAALGRALALANRAPFHILHVVCAIDPHDGIAAVPRRGRVDYRYAEKVMDVLTDEITTSLRSADITDRVHFSVHARIGKPAEEILATSREVGADLIIVGTKGTAGLARWMIGSVAETVMREAECTVEVARPKTYDHVELLAIEDTSSQPHHRFVPPHRYTYDARSVNLRPDDWPLY